MRSAAVARVGGGQAATGVFRFEIRSEDTFAYVVFNLGDTPESASVKFLRGRGFCRGFGDEYVYELFFARALENVSVDEYRSEFFQSEFLAGFASQGVGQFLAVVDVSADCRIPFAGLYVFPLGAFLEEEASAAVEDMEVNNGVEQLAAAVAFAARGFADNGAVGVDYRKYLL